MSLEEGEPTVKSFGVVYPAHAPAAGLPAFAARIEELGYDELWVVEDCFLSGGLTMAAAALAFTHLRVGVGLLPAAVRNPAIAAMEIGTLGNMFPGRVAVAFGHGVEGWMQQIGARPANRLAALEEVVTVIQALLAGETVDTNGAFVRLAAVALDAPPLVPPQILVGTTGPRGIDLAARRADGLLLPEGSTPEFVAAAAARARRAAPGTSTEIATYAWLRLGCDDKSQAAIVGAVSRWAQSGLYPDAMRAAGIVSTSGGRPPDLGTGDGLGVFGTASECARTIDQFGAAGASRMILAALAPDYEEQYAEFARTVLPVARG
jgi:5,10-methylenetetrahydromethanopterin reductase